MMKFKGNIALLFMIILVLSLPHSISKTLAQTRAKDSYRYSEQELLAYYKDFNKRFFDNKLPRKNVSINWGPGTGTMTTKYEGEPEIFNIFIGEYLRGHKKNICMNIFHEMAHLAVHMKYPSRKESGGADEDKNDRAFQVEMLRLAKIGAFREYW